jgi:23S rRNA pseudouridine1911/1915/1917 synthase
MEKINILHQDSEIVIIEKPIGVLSQKDAKGENGLVEILAEQLGKTVYPVHRLDRPVGGVMVYALSKNAAAYLSRENAFEKVYLAAVSGICAATGEMVDYLFKDSAKGKSFVVKSERKGAKYARLTYETLKTANTENGEFSLVRVKLDTGRTHQIRVQFASRGMPLMGDGKYGSRVKGEGIALWSHGLTLTHPKTKETLIFTSMPIDNAYFNIFK